MLNLKHIQEVLDKYYKIENSKDNGLHIFCLCNTVIFCIGIMSILVTAALSPWIPYFTFVYITFCSIPLTTFLLVRKAYLNLAKTFFLIASILLISIFTICVGNQNGLELALVIYLATSVFLYEKSKSIFLIALVCSLSFFSTEVYFLLGYKKLIDIPASTGTKISLFIFLIAALAFILKYVSNRNKNFQQQSDKLLIEYQEQNEKLATYNLLLAQSNQKLEESSRQLEKSNELLKELNGELETFTHIASHDLKAPLSNIGRFVDLIDKRIEQNHPEETKEFIGFIKESVNKMSSLLTDLLEMAKVGKHEAEDFRIVNLNTLTADVCIFLRVFITKKNAVITFNKLPNIKSVESELFVVFKNIIENALKYNISQVPTINISFEQKKDCVSIYFEDNGIGIPQKYNEEVFQMFKRLPNEHKFKGTGMGLAITQKVVKKLGLKIYLKDSISAGSVFVIDIPNELVEKNEEVQEPHQ